MATKGHSKDYKFGQKNNWRRSVWNEVLSRTAGREKSQPILYLAGSDDLDRVVAIDKGVPSQNLIAFDLNLSNVKNVRQGQNPSVQGDITDALWSWPEERPVCAVLLDFCSGMTWNVSGVFDAFQRKPLRNAVVMVNFMRGRDSWSNPMREMLSNAGLMVPLWSMDADSGEIVCVHSDTKHRAYQFLFWHAFETVLAAMGMRSEDDGVIGLTYPESDSEGNAEPELAAAVSLIYSGFRPRLFSYRSGVLTFDSAVFQHPARHVGKLPEPLARMFDQEVRPIERKYHDRGMVRKIAATMAIRTQRM